MAIFITPIFQPMSAYRPDVWIAAVNAPSLPEPVEIANAEVFLNGVSIATIDKSPFNVIGVFTEFYVDVQELVQNATAPISTAKSSIFGVPSVSYQVVNPDCFQDVNVSITYLYRDATTGNLTNLGITDISTQVQAYILARQHESAQALTEFIMSAGIGARFLTNQPLDFNICLNESLFLSFIGNVGNAVQVRTFDVNDVLIQTGVVSVPTDPGNQQVTVGIGPNEIRNTTFDIAGAVNIDDPNVSYYDVEYGSYGAFFVPFSERRIYRLSECCPDNAVRLHFMNRLGGADAYTFKSLTKKGQSTKSSSAQKPLTWDPFALTPHDISDKGAFKINSTANIERELESQYLTADVAEWLAELLSSPEVYLEDTAGLVPVIIEDTDQDLINRNDTELQLVRFKIKSKDSNERIIQRM